MKGHDFFLEISIFERRCEIHVNGIPLLRDTSGGRIETRLPVNHLLLPGANRLEWLIVPDETDFVPDRVGVDARLMYAAGPGQEPQPVAALSQKGALPEGSTEDATGAGPTVLGTAGPVQIWQDARTGLAMVRRDLTLDAPLLRWAWADASPIPDGDDVRDSLVEWYRYLHALLIAGQTDTLIALHAEKCAELETAYSMDTDRVLEEIALPYAHLDESWRLQTPDWSASELDFAADGRLVRLFDPMTGPLIHYRDAVGLWRSFDFWLRIEGGQWVIAR